MKNQHPRQQTFKQQGFTLVEISIVIIILAIITSLVFPSYKKLVGKAKQTEAKTTLQAIYTAQKLYFAENNKYATSLTDLDIEIPSDARKFVILNPHHYAAKNKLSFTFFAPIMLFKSCKSTSLFAVDKACFFALLLWFPKI